MTTNERRPGGGGIRSGGGDHKLTQNDTATGVDLALNNADEWWLEGALLLVAQLAHGGGYVCACSVTDHELIGLPDHPCRLGAVFAQSARLGVIEYVAHHRARRSSRHGGVHAVWRGVTR